MESEGKKTVQIKITLTLEELAILEEFAENQGKSVAGSFMTFVREANTFKVLAKTNKAFKTISRVKSGFKDNVKSIFSIG